MDRLACVNVIALPLQILWHRHPDWLDGPMAVVDRDEANGTIEWVDKEGRRAQIRPGMRYGEALSLRSDLRAGTVDEQAIDEATDRLSERLRNFSPFVEADEQTPGVFWVDAAGLEGIFESPRGWAEAIAESLEEKTQFYSAIAVGFSRFGTYAVARSVRRVVVFSTAAEERRAARKIPLARIGLDPTSCGDLQRLGIETVGQFVRLPPTGVRRRFGPKAHRLHRMARGDLTLPLQADLSDGPIEQSVRLDEPIGVSTRLVFIIKRRLNPLLGRLAERQHRITSIEIALEEGSGEESGRTIPIRPATPTVDTNRLMELVRLRLEGLSLEEGVGELTLRVHTRHEGGDQLELFAEKPPRDLADANRALERIQAEFGRDTVLRAVRREGHLPEAQYDWEPFDGLEEADPDAEQERPALVRRLWPSPRPLRANERPGRQLALPTGDGVLLGGPYIVSGGWWARKVHREYYFAEHPNGALTWIFWDERRRQWFEHGRVE